MFIHQQVTGTLRFTRPTTHLDTVGRVKEQRDVPVIMHLQERIVSAIAVPTLTGTLRFTRPTLFYASSQDGDRDNPA